MKNRNRYLLVGLVSLDLIGYCYAHMFGANRCKKWVFDAGEAVTDAPAICKDGTVLTGSYRPLFALDGTTGKKKWTFTFPVANEYQLPTAVVDADNTVYIASEVNGKPYRFYALDGSTGKIKWATTRFAAAPVLGDRHRLFLGQKQVIAVDATIGKQIWTFTPPARPDTDPNRGNYDGHIEAMAYASNTVYAAFGCPYKTLYALDAATGKPRWHVGLNSSEPFVCSVPVSLVTTEDGTPLVSQEDADVRAYDAHTGRVLWQFQGQDDSMGAQMRVGSGNALYMGTDSGFVYALDARKGTLQWQKKLGEKIYRAPVVSRDGVLYIGTHTNKVFALNASTGQIEWNLSFGWLTHSFPYGDTISLAINPDGMVYAASTDGRIYALHRP